MIDFKRFSHSATCTDTVLKDSLTSTSDDGTDYEQSPLPSVFDDVTLWKFLSYKGGRMIQI